VPGLTLEPARLLDAARTETGLDDFGDPTFRDGLDALCGALAAEARLNEAGRAAFHGQLGGYLRERLRIEDWHRRHPEIGRAAIRAPVFVTGLPRTGTTALSNLLAADPAARSLRLWESHQPTPPPKAATYDSDPRIAVADAMLAGMKTAAPDLARLHDDTGTSPTENQDLLGQHFRTQHFEGQASIPSYLRWWLACDMIPAYRHHRRVLQLLQWRCPPTRWNLKSPPDLCCLDAFVAVYPDARIVWTHRDPAKVLASVCTLLAALRAVLSDVVDLRALGRSQLALWSESVRRGLAFRRRAGEDRFADVVMDDLVARPIETMRALYARLDLPIDDGIVRRMRDWQTANPQHKHGAVAYSLDRFGLRVDEVRDAFREYVRHFDLRVED
jgi:Sulfotransferase family